MCKGNCERLRAFAYVYAITHLCRVGQVPNVKRKAPNHSTSATLASPTPHSLCPTPHYICILSLPFLPIFYFYFPWRKTRQFVFQVFIFENYVAMNRIVLFNPINYFLRYFSCLTKRDGFTTYYYLVLLGSSSEHKLSEARSTYKLFFISYLNKKWPTKSSTFLFLSIFSIWLT